ISNTGFLPIERAFLDKMVDAGYVDTFRLIHCDEPDMYSWWSYKTFARQKNVGWRIDYFFVSDELKGKVLDAKIETDVLGSDHCPVTLVLDL
uniref:exodeoxyribonuclease III n=1 Tax=Succinivibrio sp. TaxID=2053619 RepID=UPI00402A9CEA